MLRSSWRWLCGRARAGGVREHRHRVVRALRRLQRKIGAFRLCGYPIKRLENVLEEYDYDGTVAVYWHQPFSFMLVFSYVKMHHDSSWLCVASKRAFHDRQRKITFANHVAPCWRTIESSCIPHAAESDWPIELESAEALDCEGGSRRGLAHDTGLVFWAETVLDPAEDDTGQYPCSWCSCWGPIQLWRELDRRPVRVAAERAHLRIASVRSPNSQRRALAITLLRSASREAPARARAAGLWSA